MASEPSPLDDLERWAAEARARDAAEARVRERWLRTAAEEEATLRSVLLRLAERATRMTLRTTSGAQFVGELIGVGSDFAALRAAGSRLTLVPLAALGSAQAADSGHRPVGPGAADDDDLHPSLGVCLVDLLAQAAGERPRLIVDVAGHRLAGELRAVGVDILTIRASGEAAGLTYVPVQSVSAVSLLLDSG